jgi:DNA segregation ATPase FtsK/SpoIIIE-like protein
MTEITIAKDPLKRPISIDLDKKLMALLSGASGSGKSELARTICLKAAQTMGRNLALVIFDPKIVSFLGWDKRADIFTDVRDFNLALTSLENEMLRRYLFMSKNGLYAFPVSEKMPFILIVVEEISAVTQTQALIKKERDAVISLMKSISSRCRQAGMGLLVTAQYADTVSIPSEMRNNLDMRFSFRCSNEVSANLQSGDRAEEAPAYLLNLPGEMFALTSTTHNRFVRCRSLIYSRPQELEILNRISTDKPNLNCFDWTSPSFTG